MKTRHGFQLVRRVSGPPCPGVGDHRHHVDLRSFLCAEDPHPLEGAGPLNKLRLAIVSCCFLGCSPFAPGTVGTLGGVAIAFTAWVNNTEAFTDLWDSCSMFNKMFQQFRTNLKLQTKKRFGLVIKQIHIMPRLKRELQAPGSPFLIIP